MQTVNHNRQMLEEGLAIRNEAGPQLAPLVVDNHLISNLITENNRLGADIENSLARGAALLIQWSRILAEAKACKSDGIDWQALVSETVDLDRRRADELTRNARVGAFDRELMNFLDDYCGRLQAFVDEHPYLEGECKACLKKALVRNAERLEPRGLKNDFWWDVPF
jgi:hypothetical protein